MTVGSITAILDEHWAPAPNGSGGAPAHFRPGIIASTLVHAALFLALYAFYAPRPDAPLRFIPADLVLLEPETASPARPDTASAPQDRAPARTREPHPQVASITPALPKPGVETAPDVVNPKADDLEQKLQAFAKLRLPDAGAAEEGEGVSTQSASSGSGNGRAAYSVKDYIRAQVTRRWNLDISALGGRKAVIPIHVVMRRDGTILKAEIVNERRYRTDRNFYSIALSARNAVILSSPIALPAGRYDEIMDLTLDLDARDALK